MTYTGFTKLCVVALLAGRLFAGEAPCMTSPAGMTNWWPGDGNANDLVDSAQGTAHGAVTFGPGRVGSGFTFNGAGSVDFGTTAGNFGVADFTVSFWVKTTATAGTGTALVEKRAVCAFSDFWSFRMVGAANPSAVTRLGQVVVELDNTSDAGASGYALLYSQVAVNDGAYHHVALTRAGKTAKLYVDGVLRDTQTTANVLRLTNGAPLQMGASVCTNFDGTLPLVGQLDEVELFSRALTAVEVQKFWTLPLGQCLGVEIDIQPGRCSEDDDDKYEREGVVPVVIYGSALVPVAQVDLFSLTLGGSPVKSCRVSNEKKYSCRDGKPANADGYPDLFCQFYTHDAKTGADHLMSVKGLLQTPGGVRGISGVDRVRKED